jgi:hypothetical protein
MVNIIFELLAIVPLTFDQKIEIEKNCKNRRAIIK